MPKRQRMLDRFPDAPGAIAFIFIVLASTDVILNLHQNVRRFCRAAFEKCCDGFRRPRCRNRSESDLEGVCGPSCGGEAPQLTLNNPYSNTTLMR